MDLKKIKPLKIEDIPTHDEVWAKHMADPEFVKEYEALEFEFSLIDRIMEERIKNGLTQKELAEKMGTKQSSIARFESGRYNPSLEFLKKLASALNVKLTIQPRG